MGESGVQGIYTKSINKLLSESYSNFKYDKT